MNPAYITLGLLMVGFILGFKTADDEDTFSTKVLLSLGYTALLALILGFILFTIK